MAIRYVAYNRDGQRVTGTLPVDSVAAAEEILWRSELIVTSLRQEGRRRQGAFVQLAHQLPPYLAPSPESWWPSPGSWPPCWSPASPSIAA